MKRNLKKISLLMLLASSPAALMNAGGKGGVKEVKNNETKTGTGSQTATSKALTPAEMAIKVEAGKQNKWNAQSTETITQLRAESFARNQDTSSLNLNDVAPEKQQLQSETQNMQDVSFQSPEEIGGDIAAAPGQVGRAIAAAPGQAARALPKASESFKLEPAPIGSKMYIPNETIGQRANTAIGQMANSATKAGRAVYNAAGQVGSALYKAPGQAGRALPKASESFKLEPAPIGSKMYIPNETIGQRANTAIGQMATSATKAGRALYKAAGYNSKAKNTNFETVIKNLPETPESNIIAAKAAVMEIVMNENVELTPEYKTEISDTATELSNESGATPSRVYQKMTSWFNSWFKNKETSNLTVENLNKQNKTASKSRSASETASKSGSVSETGSDAESEYFI